MTQDIRWKQRFDNFTRALHELSDEVALHESRALSRLEAKGLIQSFEMVHELAWNVLKDYLEEEGRTTGLLGSKDSTWEAFKRGLIADGEVWMAMIKARNLTSHVYDEATVRRIVEAVCDQFHASFVAMHEHFLPLYERA